MMQKYGDKKDIKQILLRMKLRLVDGSSDGSEQEDKIKRAEEISSLTGM